MRILSIDIGTKNCAFYIEEFDDKLIEKSRSIDELYKIGKRCYWNVVNFERELNTGETFDVFVPIINFLDKNQKHWDLCNGIILEKQLQLNFNAQVVQHFIFSYFKNLYGPFKYISDISATRKTQVLNAPKKMNKKERKKWAIEEAKRLFSLRKDSEGIKILDTTVKADDLADCCLQLKAFQKLVFIDGGMP